MSWLGDGIPAPMTPEDMWAIVNNYNVRPNGPWQSGLLTDNSGSGGIFVGQGATPETIGSQPLFQQGVGVLHESVGEMIRSMGNQIAAGELDMSVVPGFLKDQVANYIQANYRDQPRFEDEPPNTGPTPPNPTPQPPFDDGPFPSGPPTDDYADFAPEVPGDEPILEPIYPDEPNRLEDTALSTFQGQARDIFEELKGTTTTPIEDRLMEWLEEQMLGGGGIGIRTNEDGSLDLIGSLGLPGPAGIFDIQIRDAEGNIVAGDAIRKAVQGVWEKVESLPEKLIDQAEGILEEIGGTVSGDGSILDAAGNIIGTIFGGPAEDFLSDNAWLTGNILGEVVDILNTPPETPETPLDAVSDRVMPVQDPGEKPVEEPLGTTDGETIRKDVTESDRVIPGGMLTDKPVEEPLGDTSGEVFPEVIQPDNPVIPPDPTTPPPVSGGGGTDEPPLDGGDGGGSGGGAGGGMFEGYMGGLGYELQAPRSVIYDPTDPMIQLDRIIQKSLFQGMI